MARAQALRLTDALRRSPRLLLWTATFVMFTANGLLIFSYKYLDDVARGETGTAAGRLIDEMTGAYAAWPLFMGVLAVARRFPIDRPGWQRHVPIHLAAFLVQTTAHTTLNLVLRSMLYPLAGLGPYDYGYMPVRYVMEAPNDAISYLVWLLLITFFRYYARLRDRELQTAELERGLLGARLENLRLQLQPHFLFNALNTISETMYDDPERADEMLGRMSELLRLSLRTRHEHEVPLRDELEGLGHYVALVKARFGDRLSVHTAIDPAAQTVLVPTLLLQPLVENAVRHGGVTRCGRGRIDLNASRGGERLVLEVIDDGPGAIDPSNGPEGGGVGLAGTAQRLQLLYGDEQTFAAGSEPHGGFAVRIGIPWRVAPAGPVPAPEDIGDRAPTPDRPISDPS